MAAALMGALALSGCSDGPNPFQAAEQSATTVVDGSSTDGLGDNNFIPDRDLSDCVGALERPNCGSAEKGTLGTYLVFLALILGVGFIMWRIARGVKARDAVVNAVPQGALPADGDPKSAGDPPAGPATA